MRYILIDIGCIECGENSAFLGVFSDKDRAEVARTEAENLQQQNWTGQHSFEIYEWDGVEK